MKYFVLVFFFNQNPKVHTHTHTPVDVGVQVYSCVCRQLGQMNHLGLLLQSVALIHPHIWQSDTQ